MLEEGRGGRRRRGRDTRFPTPPRRSTRRPGAVARRSSAPPTRRVVGTRRSSTLRRVRVPGPHRDGSFFAATRPTRLRALLNPGDLEAHERPPNRTPHPGPGGSPSTRATPSPRCAPASSPPTSRYAGWDRARTARCIAGMTSSADGCGAQEIKLQKMDDDTLRFISARSPAELKHPNVVELLDVVVADAPETAGRRTRHRASCISPSSSSSTIWRVCSAPPDVADHGRADETRGASTLLRARALSRAWVLHRDVKGSNLLVATMGTSSSRISVSPRAPARRSRAAHEHRRDAVVSSSRALARATKYDEADMWSVGCLLAELLLGKPAFQGQTEAGGYHKHLPDGGSGGAAAWRASWGLHHRRALGPDRPRRLRERFAESPNIVDPHALTSSTRYSARSEGSRISGGGDAKPVLHRRPARSLSSRTCPTATSTRCDTTSRKLALGVS